ncbi:MAG TPA: hypothetical protein VHZ76_10675, partial [Gammaproteobacteria bacterium]|jgi:hypothetical protein|nr:hypothetical protein [Gammaproteobacteria bacterium]
MDNKLLAAVLGSTNELSSRAFAVIKKQPSTLTGEAQLDLMAGLLSLQYMLNGDPKSLLKDFWPQEMTKKDRLVAAAWLQEKFNAFIPSAVIAQSPAKDLSLCAPKSQLFQPATSEEVLSLPTIKQKAIACLNGIMKKLEKLKLDKDNIRFYRWRFLEAANVSAEEMEKELVDIFKDIRSMCDDGIQEENLQIDMLSLNRILESGKQLIDVEINRNYKDNGKVIGQQRVADIKKENAETKMLGEIAGLECRKLTEIAESERLQPMARK